MKRYTSNPTRPGALRPVEIITDRAKRYRARKNAPPPGPCIYCGRPDANDVEHIDGNEDNGDPNNLDWSCRPCNTGKGAHFARNGAGKRTRQYNPGGQGAKTLAQYLTAVMVLKGQSDQMKLADAIKLVHNTPAADRSSFARQIWNRRKQSAAAVPF